MKGSLIFVFQQVILEKDKEKWVTYYHICIVTISSDYLSIISI